MERIWTKSRLAGFIRSHCEQLMHDWEARVRSDIAAAREQGTVALRNTLAQFIGEMADAIAPDDADGLTGESAHGTHGKQRSSVAAYSLPQVMQEYSILRVMLLEMVDREGDLPVALRNQLLTSIDAAMCEAASAFANDKEQRERRGRIDAEEDRDRVKLAAEVLRGELKSIARASALLKADRDALHGEINFVRRERDTSRDRMAEVAADASVRERFVATLAHDLRTPLGAIKMAFELLLVELPKRPEVVELTDLLYRNLMRTETMLQDLLDTRRLHAGHRLPLHLSRCNLAEIARVAVKDLAAEHGPRFVLNARRDIVGLWDAERLRRLLDNLLTNAVKYGERDRPIGISIDQDEQKATLKVHNLGNPISPEEQKTLFEAFYRAKSAESSKVKGWGLGLTLVSGVVDGHGGTIEVTSSAAEGTTFTVSLPNDATRFQDVPRS